MKHALLLVVLPWIIYSCDDIEADLPLHAINGVAFVASRDTTVYSNASEPDSTYYFYDDCLGMSWTIHAEKEPNH